MWFWQKEKHPGRRLLLVSAGRRKWKCRVSLDHLKATDGYVDLTAAFVRAVEHLEHPVRLDDGPSPVPLGSDAATCQATKGADAQRVTPVRECLYSGVHTCSPLAPDSKRAVSVAQVANPLSPGSQPVPSRPGRSWICAATLNNHHHLFGWHFWP